MAWPAKLQSMLTPTPRGILPLLFPSNSWPTAEVRNFGLSGRTAMKKGALPYWKERAFNDSRDWNPDYVIIMLGTNDCKIGQWNETEYIRDYLEMIGIYKNLPSHPYVYIAIPPPLYSDDGPYQQWIVNGEFPNRVIPAIATKAYGGNPEAGRQYTIDFFSAMGGAGLTEKELFCDMQNCDPVHPNDAGYDWMASTVYKKLFYEDI